MTHGFKGFFRKLYYILKVNPRFIAYMMIVIALFTAALITHLQLFSCLMMFLPLLYFTDELISKLDLTQCFFISRFLGRNYIYQNRKTGRGPCEENRVILKWEIANLEKALPAGRFATLTHEAVVKRLLKADDVRIDECVPVYQKDLLSLQSHMLGCKKCSRKRKCALRHMAEKPRQFYFVKFIKEREEQLNPTR